MTVEDAVEVFVRGFAFTRSLTHPYVVERIEGAWVMRDGPGTKRDPRNEEWVAVDLPPAELDRIAGAHAHGRYALAFVLRTGEPELPARAAFRSLGYRLGAVEPLFVHDLADVPGARTDAVLHRVQDEALAARLGKVLRRKPLRPEFFGLDSPCRQYVAELEGELVGWVSSISVSEAAWCANLHVKPSHRRRGIAKALMARMLEDDRACGRTANVLLSSHTGARLYPTLGYQQIGTLLLYTH